ncbi:MAG TPA: DUF1707 domain-containing protein, partial [Micromonosporaceae bacterium]|nr:DUF1707 domain-containing protein [Micromonosporaceae bacterium]
AGRLTFAEFDTRAAAAQAARTRNDLDRLFVDLPPIPAGPPAPRRLPARPVTVIATAVIAAVVAGLLVLAAPAFASGMMAGCM